MICWLVMHQRLRTIDILVKIGVMHSNPCLLCDNGLETHSHLFFQCPYAVKCLDMVKNWLKISTIHNVFQRQILYIQKSKRSGIQKRILAVVFNGLIYQLWWVRNEAGWNQVVWRPEVVFDRLKKLVQLRISLVLPQKITDRDKLWIERMLDNV